MVLRGLFGKKQQAPEPDHAAAQASRALPAINGNGANNTVSNPTPYQLGRQGPGGQNTATPSGGVGGSNSAYTYPSGDKYSGEWVNGRKHGKGTAIFVSGNEYEGEWDNDFKHGTGTIKFFDGTTYSGEWRKDHKHGQGTARFASGNVYTGEWVEDAMEGQGRFDYQRGEVYQGEWLAGKISGQGVWMSADRRVTYRGEWQDGLRHGVGILAEDDGETEVEYEKGRRLLAQEATEEDGYEDDEGSDDVVVGAVAGEGEPVVDEQNTQSPSEASPKSAVVAAEPSPRDGEEEAGEDDGGYSNDGYDPEEPEGESDPPPARAAQQESQPPPSEETAPRKKKKKKKRAPKGEGESAMFPPLATDEQVEDARYEAIAELNQGLGFEENPDQAPGKRKKKKKRAAGGQVVEPAMEPVLELLPEVGGESGFEGHSDEEEGGAHADPNPVLVGRKKKKKRRRKEEAVHPDGAGGQDDDYGSISLPTIGKGRGGHAQSTKPHHLAGLGEGAQPRRGLEFDSDHSSPSVASSTASPPVGHKAIRALDPLPKRGTLPPLVAPPIVH